MKVRCSKLSIVSGMWTALILKTLLEDSSLNREDCGGYSERTEEILFIDVRKFGMLIPGRYAGVQDLPEDDEPFGGKIARLTKELKGHFIESAGPEQTIRKNLGNLGYGL